MNSGSETPAPKGVIASVRYLFAEFKEYWESIVWSVGLISKIIGAMALMFGVSISVTEFRIRPLVDKYEDVKFSIQSTMLSIVSNQGCMFAEGPLKEETLMQLRNKDVIVDINDVDKVMRNLIDIRAIAQTGGDFHLYTGQDEC